MISHFSVVPQELLGKGLDFSYIWLNLIIAAVHSKTFYTGITEKYSANS